MGKKAKKNKERRPSGTPAPAEGECQAPEPEPQEAPEAEAAAEEGAEEGQPDEGPPAVTGPQNGWEREEFLEEVEQYRKEFPDSPPLEMPNEADLNAEECYGTDTEPVESYEEFEEVVECPDDPPPAPPSEDDHWVMALSGRGRFLIARVLGSRHVGARRGAQTLVPISHQKALQRSTHWTTCPKPSTSSDPPPPGKESEAESEGFVCLETPLVRPPAGVAYSGVWFHPAQHDESLAILQFVHSCSANDFPGLDLMCTESGMRSGCLPLVKVPTCNIQGMSTDAPNTTLPDCHMDGRPDPPAMNLILQKSASCSTIGASLNSDDDATETRDVAEVYPVLDVGYLKGGIEALCDFHRLYHAKLGGQLWSTLQQSSLSRRRVDRDESKWREISSEYEIKAVKDTQEQFATLREQREQAMRQARKNLHTHANTPPKRVFLGILGVGDRYGPVQGWINPPYSPPPDHLRVSS